MNDAQQEHAGTNSVSALSLQNTLPAAPSRAENQEQRRLLLGLMLVLIGIAAWRLFRRRRQ